MLRIDIMITDRKEAVGKNGRDQAQSGTPTATPYLPTKMIHAKIC